tara:strand:+ start:640 stop:858 length:219 start_codon:yes stop_codon:yes gene_type:complete
MHWLVYDCQSLHDVLVGEFFFKEEGMPQAEGELIAYRGLFLIDKEGKVRHQLANDLSLGRNIDGVLRMIYAL